MPPISVLIKPASGICNMKCDYCFYCDEAKKRITKSYGFMTERTLRNVIRKTMLHADGMISYVFQGGEPTLRGLEFFEKVIEYQKQYNKNQNRPCHSLFSFVCLRFRRNGKYLPQHFFCFLNQPADSLHRMPQKMRVAKQ